jgi:nucleoside-diphosphate-sugar epimerase
MKIGITNDRGQLAMIVRTLLEEQNHQVVSLNDPADTMGACELVLVLEDFSYAGPFPVSLDLSAKLKQLCDVLEAARKLTVRRVVYTSSTAYYGGNTDGRLHPLYFPVDEAHPPATCQGRATGKLARYDTYTVMAEQMVAWYGSNRLFETVVMRLAPVGAKVDQYPDGFDWRACDDYRRGFWFASCHPDGVARALVLALEAPGPFQHEVFNVADKYTYTGVDICKYLAQDYQDVEVRGGVGQHGSLVDVRKVVHELGFELHED